MDSDTIQQIHPKPTKDMTTGKQIFITITIEPELYKLPARQQYKKTIKQVQEVLSANLTSYLLIAELTEKGNIHYHVAGTVRPEYSEYVIFIKDALKAKKYIGFTDIKPIITDNGIYDYMMKDYNKTDFVINHKKTHIQIWSYFVARKRKEIQKFNDKYKYDLSELLDIDCV